VLTHKHTSLQSFLTARRGSLIPHLPHPLRTWQQHEAQLCEGLVTVCTSLGNRDAAAWVPASQVLAVAAAAEATTRHPLAEAVLSEARQRGLEVPSCSESVTEPGFGVLGMVDGQQVGMWAGALVMLPANLDPLLSRRAR
jgi:hypothetical protein